MEGTYKVTYVKTETTRKPPRQHTIKIKATSKYNAKKRFYLKYPSFSIVKTEEVQNDG